MEARFAVELPHRVQRNLGLFHHVELGMRLRVAQLVDHVAHPPVIWGLWGFPVGSRLALHLGERFRYPLGGILHHLQRPMVFDPGRAEICRVGICHCRGTARQT